MNFISGWARAQVHVLPERIEDYVGPDNLVRFLDAWVDTMDLRALGFRFSKADARGRGAPAYLPADLLRLYLYGCCQQVRSSRRLEAECARNLELLWLLCKLTSDFKTIADFRKDNAAVFKAVLRQFNQLCRQENLFGGELPAIDGTKVKAVNTADQNWTQTKLEKQAAAPTAAQLQEKIARLRTRQSEVKTALTGMAQAGASEISATDADSRAMRSKGRHVVATTCKAWPTPKRHLLVTTEAINAALRRQSRKPNLRASIKALDS